MRVVLLPVGDRFRYMVPVVLSVVLFWLCVVAWLSVFGWAMFACMIGSLVVMLLHVDVYDEARSYGLFR